MSAEQKARLRAEQKARLESERMEKKLRLLVECAQRAEEKERRDEEKKSADERYQRFLNWSERIIKAETDI